MPASCLAHLRQARARRRAAPCVWWCLAYYSSTYCVGVCRLVWCACAHPVSVRTSSVGCGHARGVSCASFSNRHGDTARVCGGHRAHTPHSISDQVRISEHLRLLDLDRGSLAKRTPTKNCAPAWSALCAVQCARCISHARSLSVCLEIQYIYISINMCTYVQRSFDLFTFLAPPATRQPRASCRCAWSPARRPPPRSPATAHRSWAG